MKTHSYCAVENPDCLCGTCVNDSDCEESGMCCVESDSTGASISVNEYKKEDSDKAFCKVISCTKYKREPGDENSRVFVSGAVRDSAFGKGRYDLLPWSAIDALAKHCERGAMHYGERNVDKGIPQKSLLDSGIRHLQKYLTGDAEEHHLVAALWNISWAVENEIEHREMVYDIPGREKQEAGDPV